MGEYPCRSPNCDKVLATEAGRRGHERITHGYIHVKGEGEGAPGAEETKSKLGGETMALEEGDIVGLINKALNERGEAEAKAKQEEGAKADLVEAIKGIGGRLDQVDTKLGKIDEDFCSKFPELCTRVENIEKGISAPKVELGTEEWKGTRTADLEHILFADCPHCTPVRDEVLKAKSKRLADLEPEAKVETKVEGAEAKVEEPVTSPFPRKGFEWDVERQEYVQV